MKSTNKTLLALSLTGALIAGSGSASASAADVVKLKLVGSHGPTTAWAWPAYQRLEERVKEATNGRVELELYAPSQLVPFVQHLEAVRAGIIDIADVVPGYYQNEFALSHLWYYMYTDLNFFDDATISARMWSDLYDQYMSIDFEKLSLDCPGDNGWPVVAYDLFTIDRPISKIEDAKGLKLRSNSAGMNKIIESMGAIPVFMGGASVPDALSKGILDGVPMSDHWGTAVPIWDYAKPGYWTVTGSFPQGVNCSAVSTRRNSKWMKKVSPEDQEAIGVELREFKMDLSRLVNEARGRFLKTAAEKGITISEWPDSEKQRLVEAWRQVIDDALEFAKKEGAPAEYMLDAMREWRKDHDGQ